MGLRGLTQVPTPCSHPGLRGWPALLTGMTTAGAGGEEEAITGTVYVVPETAGFSFNIWWASPTKTKLIYLVVSKTSCIITTLLKYFFTFKSYFH